MIWRQRKGTGGVYGVFEAQPGVPVGVASLGGYSRDFPIAEISIWVGAGCRRKGYAGEAGRLLAEQAFKKLALRKLYARIDPANRAGRKVLQKLGFKYEGCLRQEKRQNGRWVNQEYWGLLRNEWKK